MSVVDDWQAWEDCRYFLPTNKQLHQIKCSMCNEEGLHFPFVVWNSDPCLIFCSRCSENALGLQADFIHARAIAELQRLYPDWTLKRVRAIRWNQRKPFGGEIEVKT